MMDSKHGSRKVDYIIEFVGWLKKIAEPLTKTEKVTSEGENYIKHRCTKLLLLVLAITISQVGITVTLLTPKHLGTA